LPIPFFHGERNVLDHLPERDRPGVKRRLRAAWKLSDHPAALERLDTLAGELAHSHPGAAGSLREGLDETLTLQRLGVREQLWRTLSSTNPIESMIAICRATSRNVKRWQSGDMCLRPTAAGMLQAEAQFRKIIGYKHLAALAAPSKQTSPPSALAPAIRPPHRPTIPRPSRPLRSQPLTDHPIATTKFHGERDNLRDRVRQAQLAQRQALAERRHGAALDRRRHARSRATVPADHRLQGPRQARHRDRARPRRRTNRPHPRGGRTLATA